MKKLGRIFCGILRVIIHILIWGIIPLDMYLLNINEILAIVIAIGWVFIVRLVELKIIKKDQKKWKKIIYVILDSLVVLLIIFFAVFYPYWNSSSNRVGVWDVDSYSVVLTREQALKDYEFAMKYLKKIHPVAIDGLPEDVQAQAEKVKAELEQIDTIQGYELARELESIFSLLGDGHTEVSEICQERHYMKHIYEHKSAGDTLVGINGITFEDYLAEHPQLVSYETQSYAIKMLKNRSSSLEGLIYLGFDTTGEITFNYVTEDGEAVDVVVTADDFLLMEDYLNYEESVTGENLHEEEEKDFVYYEIMEDSSLAVLHLDSCSYNAHYREVVEEMFEEVHSRGLKNVAVDLRNNSGGSSLVANEFIKYLNVDSYMDWASDVRTGPLMWNLKATELKNKRKGYGFDGEVYIITSVFSYSSSMDFAMLIQDNGIGKVVGEASGNLPSSYGDIVEFILPESGLYMQVSIKKWYRVDTSKNEEPVEPDIPCDPNKAIEVLEDMLD